MVISTPPDRKAGEGPSEVRVVAPLRGWTTIGDGAQEARTPSASPSEKRQTSDAWKKRVREYVMTQLSPDDRLLMVLRYFEGLHGREIAAVLERTEAAVMTRLNTLLAELRRTLDADEAGGSKSTGT